MECKSKLLGPSQADGICYEFVNIREHCAWVHAKEPQKAMDKAKALIAAGMARVRESQLQAMGTVEVKQTAAVIGAGPAGIQAVADLAARGFPTTLISVEPILIESIDEVTRGLLEGLRREGVTILEGKPLEDVQGTVGEFRISIEDQGELRVINAGVIIVDLDVKSSRYLPQLLKRAVAVDECELGQMMSRLPGVFVCYAGSGKKKVERARAQGSAAAVKASALLHHGELRLSQTVASVDPFVCRGCGTCTRVCEFGAPSLIEMSNGVFISRIDENVCSGCGTCVAHCPSCAITQVGLSDSHITGALEAILTSF